MPPVRRPLPHGTSPWVQPLFCTLTVAAKQLGGHTGRCTGWSAPGLFRRSRPTAAGSGAPSLPSLRSMSANAVTGCPTESRNGVPIWLPVHGGGHVVPSCRTAGVQALAGRPRAPDTSCPGSARAGHERRTGGHGQEPRDWCPCRRERLSAGERVLRSRPPLPAAVVAWRGLCPTRPSIQRRRRTGCPPRFPPRECPSGRRPPCPLTPPQAACPSCCRPCPRDGQALPPGWRGCWPCPPSPRRRSRRRLEGGGQASAASTMRRQATAVATGARRQRPAGCVAAARARSDHRRAARGGPPETAGWCAQSR